MNLQKFISRFIPAKLFLYIFTAIIIVQLMVFIFYVSRVTILQNAESQNQLLIKIYNIIRTIQHAEPDERSKIVSALDSAIFKINHSTLEISITQMPIWEQHKINEAYWVMSEILHKKTYLVQASFEIKPNEWLNISLNAIKNVYKIQLIFLIFEVIIAIIILITVWSIQRFTVPLKKFKQVAERLGIDYKTTPLIEFGPTIVKDATVALNKMQLRIQNLIEMRTQMLAAISHDLRTPLTKIELSLALIDDKSDQLKNIEIYLNEMEQMIAEILAFAKEDKIKEEKTRFDLNSMLQSICHHYEDVSKKIDYTSQCKVVAFYGRRLAMQRVFDNIIQNSMKYAYQSKIKLNVVNDKIVIQFEDQGAQLSHEETEQLTTPYYRAMCHRKSIPGTGLGLSVAAEIISQHGGELKIEKNQPTGLIITITLPVTSRRVN